MQPVKNTEPDHTICQNFGGLTYLKLQPFLVTCLLFFNSQYQILYQNTELYNPTLVVSNMLRFATKVSNVKKTPSNHLISKHKANKADKLINHQDES